MAYSHISKCFLVQLRNHLCCGDTETVMNHLINQKLATAIFYEYIYSDFEILNVKSEPYCSTKKIFQPIIEKLSNSNISLDYFEKGE